MVNIIIALTSLVVAAVASPLPVVFAVASPCAPAVFAVNPHPAACNTDSVLEDLSNATTLLQNMETQVNSIPSQNCSIDDIAPLVTSSNNVLQQLNWAGWDSSCAGEFSEDQGDTALLLMNNIQSVYHSIDSTLLTKKDCIYEIGGNIQQIMGSLVCTGTSSIGQSFPTVITNLATKSQQSQAIVTYGQIQSDIALTGSAFGGSC